MTDDIVTRLREAYKNADEVSSVFLTNEAANHIENLVSQLRIQAEVVNGKNYHTISGGLHFDAADEIERLLTLLDNTLERENKDNARQLDIVRKVEADRNRWRATAEVLARELGKVEYADAEWRNQEGLH